MNYLLWSWEWKSCQNPHKNKKYMYNFHYTLCIFLHLQLSSSKFRVTKFQGQALRLPCHGPLIQQDKCIKTCLFYWNFRPGPSREPKMQIPAGYVLLRAWILKICIYQKVTMRVTKSTEHTKIGKLKWNLEIKWILSWNLKNPWIVKGPRYLRFSIKIHDC